MDLIGVERKRSYTLGPWMFFNRKEFAPSEESNSFSVREPSQIQGKNGEIIVAMSLIVEV